MKKSGWRLALSAVLFACWIGYLAFLAFTTTHPIVLSRPQFLSADLYVIAEVPADPAKTTEPATEVKVKKIVWTADAEDNKRATIEVFGLQALEGEYGWDGPGEYILALTRTKDRPFLFTVTGLPRTPGFPRSDYPLDVRPRIYHATPATLRQLELLTQEYHPGNNR